MQIHSLVRPYFDFMNPWLHAVQAWDESGNRLETIAIENVTRKTPNDQTFNRRNPECTF